ncbi:MAG TPA: LytTR family DNA-binding domain-containing protein [Gemmatimonadales bacterium]|nr:LytTR family DNA-binding domain-containing protein [Gemmatimonadales bacterium]
MAELRVLLVDDEPLVRRGIRDFLDGVSDVRVVGECGDGVEALAFLEREPADLVFLDVQMPELDGVAVASVLAGGSAPAIVFVTAFSEHAIRAFEVNAVDYLLKPFDRERFLQALQRARARRAAGADRELGERLGAVLAALAPVASYAERLLVRSDGRIRLVPVADIDWIEAADNYVRLHAGTERHLLRETMASLEGRLDPERFGRIHRSAMVNFASVRELQPTFNGEYTVFLRSGAKLTLSRSYRDALLERLGR